MTANDPARLTAIRTREQAATTGPWKAEASFSPAPYHTPSWSVVDADHHPSVQLTRYVADICHGLEDAEFIAHAREDIPYLLAEIARLQTRESALNTALKKMNADNDELGETVERLRRFVTAAEAARDEAHKLADVRLEMFQREHERLTEAVRALARLKGEP